MGKLIAAVVIADRGVEIDESVRVLLPDDMLRRFADAIETKKDKKGKPVPVVKAGAHVVTRRMTLKRGLKVMIDMETLTRLQELQFAPTASDREAAADDEAAALTEAAKAEWATLTDEQKATFKDEADFVGQYIAASKKTA